MAMTLKNIDLGKIWAKFCSAFTLATFFKSLDKRKISKDQNSGHFFKPAKFCQKLKSKQLWANFCPRLNTWITLVKAVQMAFF